jgi:hypothetical protein
LQKREGKKKGKTTQIDPYCKVFLAIRKNQEGSQLRKDIII